MSQEWESIQAAFVKDRVPVYWGDFSQIEATIALVKLALSSSVIYSKLVLISGSCYPIRPMRELEALFNSDNGYNYIGRIPVDASEKLRWMTEHRFHCGGFVPWQLSSRSAWARLVDRGLRRIYFETVSKIRRPWTSRVRRFHGSQWWALSPECGGYVIERFADEETASLYRKSMIPDEQFFHSIVADSVFKEISGPDVPFIGVGAHVAANLHIIDPALKKWFTISDFEEIGMSERFFVRKVSTSASAELLDKIDDMVAARDAGFRDRL